MKSKSGIFECLIAPIPKQIVSPTGIGWKKKHRIGRVKRFKRLRIKNKPRKSFEVLRSYKLYIKSEYWIRRRSKHFLKFGNQCVICGSTKQANVHHMYYGDYSNEKEEHLVTLCHHHHEMFHEGRKTKKDMIWETNQFIIEQKELNDFPVFL